MTNRERFRAVFNFEMPDDRLPVAEWAPWWNVTVEAWNKQGLPEGLSWYEMARYFDLDPNIYGRLTAISPDAPTPKFNGGPIMEEGEEGYEKLLPYLYKDSTADGYIEFYRQLKPYHESGEVAVWYAMDGAFWFPRSLFGIEPHLYSFYDYPDLYKRITNDLAEYQIKQLERMYEIVTPEFMAVSEDMSYNNGPMISEDCFDEFLLPYYQKVVPFIKEHGTKVLLDSDGEVSKMIPWLQRAGIEGVMPLERKAGVDVTAIREAYPDFLLFGAFDKMTMRESDEAMKKEFQRLLPVLKTGGFVPGVDHQTPPDCPLERYKKYVEMLKEYAVKAVKE